MDEFFDVLIIVRGSQLIRLSVHLRGEVDGVSAADRRARSRNERVSQLSKLLGLCVSGAMLIPLSAPADAGARAEFVLRKNIAR
jgi:hypothetical protein